jgi:hypothetical protein
MLISQYSQGSVTKQDLTLSTLKHTIGHHHHLRKDTIDGQAQNPETMVRNQIYVTSVCPKKGAKLNMSFQTDTEFPEDTMIIDKNQVAESISTTKRRNQSILTRFSADRDLEVSMNDTELSTATLLC